MYNMKNFAQFLVGKRREKNITQGQLADMVGVSHQAVSKWERGETMPEISKLSDLSSALNVSTEDILTAMHTDSGVPEAKAENKDHEYYALPDKTLVGDVCALAPYLSKEALTTAITEIAIAKGSGIAKILFKYADEEILREVALLVFAADTDKGRLDLVPYLPQEEITKLILNRYSSGGIGSMLPLLPFSKDFEVVDMIFKSIVSTHGNWNVLKPVVSDLMPEVVVTNGIDYAVKHGIGCFGAWWGVLGKENIAKIFIGYCRHFDHSLRAWSDIAPHLGRADKRLILDELDKMKADGYNFDFEVNPLQLQALPADIRDKLVEYGVRPDARGVPNNNWTGNIKIPDINIPDINIPDLGAIFANNNFSEFGEYIQELESRIDELESRIDDLED
ncbi:MAG: helix-turn-helix domain-containing protein, partial [Clostridia bacterium]|nr:helix-turn-helix domain-containing protein [Clostridia bacterium]